MPQPTSPSLSSFKPQRGMDCTDDDRPCALTTKQGSKTTTQLEQKKIQTAVTVERHAAIQEILRDPKASEAQKRSKIQSLLGITPILLKKQQDDDSEDSPPTFLENNAWFEQDNDDLDSRNEPYTIESTKQRESTTIQQRGIVIAQEHDDISENQQGKDNNFYLEQKKVSPAPANPKYLPMTPRCKRCPWGRHCRKWKLLSDMDTRSKKKATGGFFPRRLFSKFGKNERGAGTTREQDILLNHMTTFSHALPMCEYGSECNALSDFFHNHTHYHPQRSGPMGTSHTTSTNITSTGISSSNICAGEGSDYTNGNEGDKGFPPLFMYSDEFKIGYQKMKRLEGTWKYRHFRQRPLPATGYELLEPFSALQEEMKENGLPIPKRILNWAKAKFEHKYHESLGRPLDWVELLSLVLYTDTKVCRAIMRGQMEEYKNIYGNEGPDCFEGLSSKWVVTFWLLGEAVRKLSAAEAKNGFCFHMPSTEAKM